MLINIIASSFIISTATNFIYTTTTEAQHQVEGRLLLDVVVGEGAAILELLARKDQALLVRGDALLVLDLALDHIDGVGALNLESDGLACDP